jgi:DNA-binding NarL/FixJ family response regulator
MPDAPEEAPIRVLIVDDHEMLAESLRRLLESRVDIDVVGVAGSASDGVDAAARLGPDVVLMDYELPDGDGVTAAAQIKRARPATQVLMLTGAGDDDDLARRALDAGCSGLLSKAGTVDELLAAVRAAHVQQNHPRPGSES